MNLEERLIAWLEWNKRPCEERDLLNDALEELQLLKQQLDDAGDGDTWKAMGQRAGEELERTREQLKAICDGVNRRCGADANQLPLVSLDKLTARLAEANRRLSEIRDELCGNGFEISGWHNNGDMEPIDTWWEDNDWGPVEENGGRDE